MDPIQAILQMQQQIEKLQGDISTLQNNPPLQDHRHNSFDTSPVYFTDIFQKKIWIPMTVVGTSAATTTNYGVFFIAPVKCYVSGVKEVHQTAGTDGAAVTVSVEKLTGTTAAGSGSDLLTTALSLKATINTVQTGVLTTTLASRSMAIGDRLALKLTGTPTTVSGVTVLTELTLN